MGDVMAAQINSKIVGYKVLASNEPVEHDIPKPDKLNESTARPELLFGSTYKVKTPQSEHALYITVNDIILNIDTEHEERRPYEIFINSKNMEHYAWIVALTRIMSATFRKGGEIKFLVDELKVVFDPAGGYWKKGGVFMPSLVAEIGHVLEAHLKRLGMIEIEQLGQHQKEFIEAKKAEYGVADSGYPDQATLCSKCNTKAMVLMDGCKTCLSCGDSKCG